MLIYQKLSDDIKQACFEVHSTLGTGFLEKCYEKALLHELDLRGFKCDSQVPIEVNYKGKVVGNYVVDILVEDKIILELKCVSCLTNEHFAQTIHYLNATNYSLGLLINFGAKKLEFRRVVNSSTKN